MFINKKVFFRFYSLFFISLMPVYCYSQDPKLTEDWSVKPEVVIPGKKFSPPSDALVLFDGSDFSKWSGQNGILIQDHVELKGPTVFVGYPEYQFHEEKLPLLLQNHGNTVEYRNIWIREL